MRRAWGLSGAAVGAAAAYWVGMSPWSQTLGAFPYRGSAGGDDPPQIALTFDDGPNEPYTSMLADLLAQRGVPATFFQVGQAVARHPDVTRRLFTEGHVVGNHSWSHRVGRCLDPRALPDEVGRTQDLLGEVLGVAPALYRPPWLLRIPALFDTLQRHGLRAVSGEFAHPLEVLQPAPERIATGATRLTDRPGAVVIFHDGWDGKRAFRGHTVDAVARVIDTLADRGHTFTTVDRLLGLAAYQA